MANQGPARPEDTIDAEEASALLEVPPDRIEVLVQEGLLTRSVTVNNGGSSERRFLRYATSVPEFQ